MLKNPDQHNYINKAQMFEILHNMAIEAEQYYDNNNVPINKFNNILKSFFNKDELCVILDSLYYKDLEDVGLE